MARQPERWQLSVLRMPGNGEPGGVCDIGVDGGPKVFEHQSFATEGLAMQGLRGMLLRAFKTQVTTRYMTGTGLRGAITRWGALEIVKELEQRGPAPETMDGWTKICRAAKTTYELECAENTAAKREREARGDFWTEIPDEEKFPVASHSKAYVCLESYLYLYWSNEQAQGRDYLRPCVGHRTG